MANAVWIVSYQLNEEASAEDFLVASQKCYEEIFIKQKGFISWDVLRDGETWIDLLKWETIEDAKNGQTKANENPIAHDYFEFINMSSVKLQTSFIERSYYPK